MNRRNMLKGAAASLLAPMCIGKAKAADIEEERTREYLDRISLWDERVILLNGEDEHHKEFLFTGGVERKEVLDYIERDHGCALVYSPRHIIQEGHFFDLIYVKIGNKNVTGIVEVFKRKPSPFERLPDCMNA